MKLTSFERAPVLARASAALASTCLVRLISSFDSKSTLIIQPAAHPVAHHLDSTFRHLALVDSLTPSLVEPRRLVRGRAPGRLRLMMRMRIETAGISIISSSHLLAAESRARDALARFQLTPGQAAQQVHRVAGPLWRPTGELARPRLAQGGVL